MRKNVTKITLVVIHHPPLNPPAAIKDNAAFASLVINKNDLDGASYLEFIGLLGASDIAMATLKVMESDIKTNATTLGATPTLVKDSTTKPSATDDDKPFVFGIDLRNSRKRYLQLQGTAGDGALGTFLAAIAIASRPHTASALAADREVCSPSTPDFSTIQAPPLPHDRRRGLKRRTQYTKRKSQHGRNRSHQTAHRN